MAAARKSQSDQKPVFATVFLLPTFKPGDRLDGHLQPAVIELLLARGEAAYEWEPEPEPEPEEHVEVGEISIREALAAAAIPDPFGETPDEHADADGGDAPIDPSWPPGDDTSDGAESE